jgi:hypothetical protein
MVSQSGDPPITNDHESTPQHCQGNIGGARRFNAEYGQVQSGIVNVVTMEGGKRGYTGSLQVKYTPPHAKYYQINGIPDVSRSGFILDAAISG